MYPCCLWIPGHLHMFFNALESAVMQQSWGRDFMDNLSNVLNFLGDRDLRRKFQYTCLQGLPCFNKFNQCPKKHADWRLETLEDALKIVLPLLQYLYAHFDGEKLLEGSQSVSRNKVNDLKATLALPEFPLACELVYVHGKNLGSNASRLESCHCHEHIWTQHVSFKRKRSMLQAETGSERCVWKGRRGPWFVCVGLNLLLSSVMNCLCEGVEAALAICENAKRLELLTMQHSLRSALVEELRSKLFLWLHIPYKALGIFWACVGGVLATSKQVCRECFAEFDRVAKLFFKVGGAVRTELESWLQAVDVGLEHFHVAFVALQEYSLCKLVERSVERVHALIKRIGAVATHCNPPFVCAKLREPEHLHILRSNLDFRSFLLDQWGRRNLLNRILKLRLDKPALNKLNYGEKTKCVYQCDIASDYMDTTSATVAQAMWEAARPAALRAAPLSDAWTLAVKLFKNTLAQGFIYSLPESTWEMCLAGGEACQDVDGNPVDFVLSHFLSSGAAQRNEPTRFFQVINAAPQSRFYVPLPHLAGSPWQVVVNECLQVASRGKGGDISFVLHVDADRQQRLDMRGLVTSAGLSCFGLLRWRKAGMRSTCKPRLYNVPARQAVLLDTYELTPSTVEAIVEPIAVPTSIDVCGGEVQVLRALGQMTTSGADMNFLDFNQVDWTTIVSMEDHNVARITEDVWGDQQVSLQVHNTCWSFLTLVDSPAIHLRSLSHISWELLPKLALILLLELDDWIDAANPDPWTLVSARVYVRKYSRPWAYFACLVRRDDVIKKVPRIYHDRPNAYYQGLLRLPASQLSSDRWMAASLNSEFMSMLKDSPTPMEDLLGIEEDEPEPIALPLALMDEAGICSIHVILWRDESVDVLRFPPTSHTNLQRGGIPFLSWMAWLNSG